MVKNIDERIKEAKKHYYLNAIIALLGVLVATINTSLTALSFLGVALVITSVIRINRLLLTKEIKELNK